MCAQCWTAAATAASGATGLRAFAAGMRPRWLSEARLKALSIGLITVAIMLATVRIS
jgi:hypothetical protein